VTEENTKKANPISKRGLPKSVWVGIRQYFKLGSPRIGLGFIPIWGPTYAGGGYDVGAATSELVLPPPHQKINPKSPSKNKGATPSPGRFSPNPVVLRLIVVFSAIVTGWIVRFRPPGQKM